MQLNKWLGTDKPKKDDFNNDNQKVDDAVRLLFQTIDQLSVSLTNGISASDKDLASLSGSVSSHTGNAGIHVTSAEKQVWNNAGSIVIGSYQGDGLTQQKVTLGYQPRFGLLFPVNDAIVRASWVAEQLQVQCGFISELGCSLGITSAVDGFTVQHNSSGGIDGLSTRFNISGTKYVYIIWK